MSNPTTFAEATITTVDSLMFGSPVITATDGAVYMVGQVNGEMVAVRVGNIVHDTDAGRWVTTTVYDNGVQAYDRQQAVHMVKTDAEDLAAHGLAARPWGRNYL